MMSQYILFLLLQGSKHPRSCLRFFIYCTHYFVMPQNEIKGFHVALSTTMRFVET